MILGANVSKISETQAYEKSFTDDCALSCEKSFLIFSASWVEIGKSSTSYDDKRELGSNPCVRCYENSHQ